MKPYTISIKTDKNIFLVIEIFKIERFQSIAFSATRCYGYLKNNIIGSFVFHDEKYDILIREFQNETSYRKENEKYLKTNEYEFFFWIEKETLKILPSLNKS